MITNNIIFTADDGGISHGVNSAIEKMINSKKLSAVSLFANGLYTANLIQVLRNNPQVGIGLHFNLTTGKCSYQGNFKYLTTKDRNFRNSFVLLCLLVLFLGKKILNEIELELEAQLNELLRHNIAITHIDGHRHVHFIPRILSLVQRLSRRYNINNIRIINEKFLLSVLCTKNYSFITNGGIVKFILLKAFYYINSFIADVKTDRYFFSILYSCKISKALVSNIKACKKLQSIEIMLHPGDPDLDAKDSQLLYERQHLLSKYRKSESEI